LQKIPFFFLISFLLGLNFFFLLVVIARLRVWGIWNQTSLALFFFLVP
jgi:hypothetical protein